MQTLPPLVIALSLTASAPAQVRYTVTDLGTFGNFTAKATAISDTGWIVGFANNPQSGYDRAVLWRAGNNPAQQPMIITGEGASGAAAWGVNDAGTMVGMTDSLALNGFAFDASVVGASVQPLGNLGGFGGIANAINDAGVVVGSASTNDGFSHAVKWTRQNGAGPYTMTPLQQLGGYGSSARAINSAGMIVGTADLPNFLGAPCYWPASGGSPVPMNIDTSSFGEALAVNDLGQAVGYSYTETGTVAFFWSQETGEINLGNLGNHHASASGINNRGEVVGQSYIPGTSATQHGFVWRNGVMHDLQTMIPADSGWILWDAVAIANDGRIVGGGVHNGTAHAFLLTPIVCAADVGGTGGAAGPDGLLDNNDFVVFIDAFFAMSPTADRGRTGGTPGPDGTFDNNDFIVYIDQFFAGC
jgi:probable HAF family extracellular repeat protein